MATAKSPEQVLRRLTRFVLLVAASGVGLVILITISTLFDSDLLDREFCLRNGCIKNFLEALDQSVLLVIGTVQLLVALATVGGVYVALLTYVNSASSNALSNHLSHIEVFTGYLSSELAKRPAIATVSVDALFLYNTMFAGSISGSICISKDYKFSIGRLNAAIAESNRLSNGTPGSFRYTDHQTRMKLALSTVGVSIERMPRNDFFEIEREVFILLDRLHKAFDPSGGIPAITQPNYA